MTPEEKKKVDRDLLGLFITDYQPFRIVEDEGFKNFAKNIPGYTLPNRKTISSAMIPALYHTDLASWEINSFISLKLVKMKELISQDARSICITTDIWTSSQTESFIGVTAHYLDSNFNPKQVLLECKGLNESHTSANLARALKTVTDEWNVRNKVNFAISDNARSIVKAIETELQWKHYGCYAHSLNLIVASALRPLDALIENVKKIVAHFNGSTGATDMLLSYQIKNMADCGEPKRLIQQVPTRWNSIFYMLRRFVLLKVAVKHCMALIERDWPEVNTMDWAVMGEVCKVLQPFEEVTSTMSGSHYLTGSMVIVVTNCLKDICDDFLNPGKYCSWYPDVEEIITSLKSGLTERFSSVEHTNVNIAQNVSTSVSAWDKFDDLLRKNKPQGNAQARAIRELQMYLDDEMLPRKDFERNWNNPAQWWRDHRIIYPHLSELYRNKCNIVATSVPCERLFSKTGLIINERRCRLKSKKVEQLAFLNANLSLSKKK
ncbi:unnamed protein product, partial [Brenthis ino]